MTGRFEPQGVTGAGVDVALSPAGVAVVFGASGGIGGALFERSGPRKGSTCGRFQSQHFAIDRPAGRGRVRTRRGVRSRYGHLRLVIDATGFLHDDAKGQRRAGKSSMTISDVRGQASAAPGSRSCWRRSAKAGSARWCRSRLRAWPAMDGTGTRCWSSAAWSGR